MVYYLGELSALSAPATEINVAEIGTKPNSLTTILALLEKSQDDLSALLADAVKAKMGIEE